jgi:hypothetical protein
METLRTMDRRSFAGFYTVWAISGHWELFSKPATQPGPFSRPAIQSAPLIGATNFAT